MLETVRISIENDVYESNNISYWNQIFDDVHMWKWVNLGLLGHVIIDSPKNRGLEEIQLIIDGSKEWLRQTSEAVLSVDVHRTRSANTLTTRTSESERGILLVLDLDERVQDHHTAVVEIDVVLFQVRLVTRLLRVLFFVVHQSYELLL